MKRDYTRKAVPNQVHLVTIECLYQEGNIREMEDTIDSLRQYGSAAPVKRELVAESWETACNILQRRAVKAQAE